MSRNIKDWTINDPIKGNRYKLWTLRPGSVFTISTSTGTIPFQILKQKGTLTQCLSQNKNTWMDSSVEVSYLSGIDEICALDKS